MKTEQATETDVEQTMNNPIVRVSACAGAKNEAASARPHEVRNVGTSFSRDTDIFFRGTPPQDSPPTHSAKVCIGEGSPGAKLEQLRRDKRSQLSTHTDTLLASRSATDASTAVTTEHCKVLQCPPVTSG